MQTKYEVHSYSWLRLVVCPPSDCSPCHLSVSFFVLFFVFVFDFAVHSKTEATFKLKKSNITT